MLDSSILVDANRVHRLGVADVELRSQNGELGVENGFNYVGLMLTN